MMKSQRSDTKKNNLIQKGKRMGVDEIVRQNNFSKVSSINLSYYIV